MPVRWAISRSNVVRSSVQNSLRWVWPQARASTPMSSVLASKKRCSRSAPSCTGKARPQLFLLRRDADRAVVGGTRPHADAADRLHRRVRHRDGVGAERERLGEVGVGSQTTGDHEGDVAATTGVEVAAGPGERRDRRHRDVVAEDDRRGAGPTTAAVEDDVVDADPQRRVDVVLDVLGGELGPDRDAARRLTDLVGDRPVVVLEQQETRGTSTARWRR